MRDVDRAEQQLVFCNSYHLLLQPGPEIIEGEFQVFTPRNYTSMNSLGSNMWPVHRPIVHIKAIDSMQNKRFFGMRFLPFWERGAIFFLHVLIAYPVLTFYNLICLLKN